MKSIQGLWPCSAYSRCSVVRAAGRARYIFRSAVLVDGPRLAAILSAPVIVSRSPIYSRRPEPTSAFGRPAGPARPVELPRCVGDVARVDARRRQQLGRRPGPRHRSDRELRDGRMGLLAREHVEHRVADAALRPVILDGDDRPGLASGGANGLRVDRLDGIQVDHPRADAFRGQLLRGGQRLVQRDAGADDRHDVVIGPAHDAAATDVERLAGLVEDRRLLARQADEDDALAVGHLRHERGGLVRVDSDRGPSSRARREGTRGPRAPSATGRPRRC